MVQYTRKAITEGFIELLNERPFDKISVVDIAEKCGITRNTFYYYYADIYALVDELFRAETDRILSREARYDSWQDAFLQVTAFARANRRAIFHLYNSMNRDRVEKYLYDVVLAGMTSSIREEAEGLSVPEADIRTLSVFYTAALLGLMTKWLQDGMKDDVDAYIADIGRLLEGNIRLTLERAAARPDDTSGANVKS